MTSETSTSAVTVVQQGEHLVAVRTAADADAADRLRHEATVLARIDHPGVVRLVDHDDGPPARLRTVFVGPDTWRSRPPTGSEVARGLAALATTLTDLHGLGLTHGDLRPDHVLVGSDDRPVLCGLGRSVDVDPSTIDTDVQAFVALGTELAGRAGDDRGPVDTALAALAAGTTDLVGTARELQRRRLPAATPAPRFDRRRLAIGALAAVATLAAVSATRAGADADADRPAATSLPTTTTVIAVAPTTSADPPPAVPAAGAPELVHDGRRYAVGRPGDVVVTGDWDCDGTATLALLRPETGEVAVFATWPPPRGAAPPATRTTVDGATDLVIDDSPCPTLRATTPTGSRLIPTGDP